MWTSILCLSSLVVYSAAQTAEQLAKVNTADAAIQKEILDAMNDCRGTVNPSASNMLEMLWSKDAAKTAEKWAKQCKFQHSAAADKQIPGDKCGENLYMDTYFTTWKEAIKKFCDEQKDFEYGKGKKDSGGETAHYTQQVWHNSYKVGCHCNYCPSGKYRWFFVCHQCPAGNISPVLYPYKSGSSCGQCPNNCRNDLCTNPCTYRNAFTNCESLKTRCNNQQVKDGCPASCQCKTEIV